MNSKNVAIIVVVAIAVAAVSFGTFLMDSQDDTDVGEARDYLVVGDWVEYETNGEVTRCTVTEVECIDRYVVDITGQGEDVLPYNDIVIIIDPDTEYLQFLRTETIDTFLGEVECDVYDGSNGSESAEVYVHASTNLLMYVQAAGPDGARFEFRLTGTSIFDAVDTDTRIALSDPVAGSVITHINTETFITGDFLDSFTEYQTLTVESVNEDGTLNVAGEEQPFTAEEFMATLFMSEDELQASTLQETRVFSTQWGVMECDVYNMPYLDSDGNHFGDRWFVVDPDTGLLIHTWLEEPDIEIEGVVYDMFTSSYTLSDCDLVLVAY